MNGIGDGGELVQMRHLTHFSTPPISIYILNHYKFIGADEMRQCACGCGTWIEDKRRYVNGHNSRGENNPNCGKHRYPELEDKGWLISKYWVEYKSSIGIAEIIGCSVGSVLDALVNLNIPRRGYSDYYGELHHSYGKTLSEETRLLISEHHVDVSGENHPLFGKHHSEEVKKKMGESHIGLHTGGKNPNWKGGISFEPYCTKFNNALKEEIRDKFGRKCFLCPKTEEDEGRKLSVHHVDYNKEQGCNGVRWLLVPLCRSCNTKVNHNRDYWQDLITEKLRKEGYL